MHTHTCTHKHTQMHENTYLILSMCVLSCTSLCVSVVVFVVVCPVGEDREDLVSAEKKLISKTSEKKGNCMIV